MKVIAFVISLLGWVLSDPAFAAPNIQQWQSSNDVRVLYVSAPELPMLDIAITFDAGSGRDAALSGISQLTHSMLSAGVGVLDADAVAEKFESLGAQFRTSVHLDRSMITFRSLTDAALLTPALETFIEVVTKPSFPERDFLRIKNQTLIAIQHSSQLPAALAQRIFYKAIYNDHPYAHPSMGYEETVAAIRLEDVRNFYRQYLVAGNANIAIVGGVDQQQAKEIAERIATHLPEGEPAGALPEPTLSNEVTERYLPFPSQQAHVYLGHLGIPRGDPDYFALYTGNHILGGGGFTSRLVKEVRVKRGLSYSVYSYFFPMRLPGTYTLGLQTQAEQAHQAVQISLRTMEKFIQEGPTEEELVLSKKSIIGGFPLRMASNQNILGYLSLIAYYQLPLDYLETFTDNISSVTRAQIRTAFSKHLHIDRLVKVIVGVPEEPHKGRLEQTGGQQK